MQKIERLIENISDLYDIELLKKELNIIKESICEKDTICEVLKTYKQKYLLKIDSFNSEFKFLNEYNYNLLNSIKTNKISLSNKELITLAIETEQEIVKSIKETLQNIVNQKEKTLRTYKWLVDFIEKYNMKEGVLD